MELKATRLGTSKIYIQLLENCNHREETMFFIRVIALVFSLIVSVQGYCIYNRLPTATISVTQTRGYGGDQFS